MNDWKQYVVQFLIIVDPCSAKFTIIALFRWIKTDFDNENDNTMTEYNFHKGEWVEGNFVINIEVVFLISICCFFSMIQCLVQFFTNRWKTTVQRKHASTECEDDDEDNMCTYNFNIILLNMNICLSLIIIFLCYSSKL